MKKRKFISALLSLAMVISMLPMTLLTVHASDQEVLVSLGKPVTLSNSAGNANSGKKAFFTDGVIHNNHIWCYTWCPINTTDYAMIDLEGVYSITSASITRQSGQGANQAMKIWVSKDKLTAFPTEATATLLGTTEAGGSGTYTKTITSAQAAEGRYVYVTGSAGNTEGIVEVMVFATPDAEAVDLLAGKTGKASWGEDMTAWTDGDTAELIEPFGGASWGIPKDSYVLYDLGAEIDLKYFYCSPTRGTDYYLQQSLFVKASNTNDISTATTLIAPFADTTDRGTSPQNGYLKEISGKYRYIWVGASPVYQLAIDDVRVYGYPPTYIFGDWKFSNDNTTITAENTVEYIDQDNQDSIFMLFATNYDSEGKMVGDIQAAPIQFDKTAPVHEFGGSFTSSIDVARTQFVLLSTDDSASRLNLAAPIVYHDWSGSEWAGFNAEKGTATAFKGSVSMAKNAEYPFTEVSATISGKSVAEDDLIHITVMPATSTLALTPSVSEGGLTYQAFVESKNGYEVNIPFAEAGDYNITVTRYSTGESENFPFSFPDSEDVQDAINAFFADDVNYADAIDEAVNGVGIVAKTDLINYDAFAAQNFAKVAPLFGVIEESQSLRDAVSGDIVIQKTDDLTEILNTVLTAYELSKGNTAIMDKYGELITGDANVKAWVEDELGYSMTADVKSVDKLEGKKLTNLRAKGIIEFTFTEAMKPSTLTSANVVLTRGGDVDTYTVAYATENGFAIDLGSLNSNENYTLTFKSGCKTADNKSMLEEKKFDFSTGDIIDVPYVAGKQIENIILNKTVLNESSINTSNGGDSSVSNPIDTLFDGDTSQGSSFPKGASVIVDLGAYFTPVAVKFNTWRVDYFWHYTGLEFRGAAYPELDSDGIPKVAGFETAGGGIKFHTISSEADVDAILPLSNASGMESYGPIRYLCLYYPTGSTFAKEIELYAYVDVAVGPIEVDNTNLPAENESYTFTANITDYQAADTDPYMIAFAYDANGKVEDIDVAAATEPSVSATVKATADTVGVTAMVVEDLSTMALISDPVTVGSTPASTKASANGVAIDSTVDKISFSVKADDNISQNTAYAAFVIREDSSIKGENVSEAFKKITPSNLKTADILFANAATVGSGAKYEVKGLEEGQAYFINVVANGKQKVVKQRKQTILGETEKDSLIATVKNADVNTIVDAIEAILEAEAISKEDINDYDALAEKLQDPRFPELLYAAVKEIEGTATFETIADAINDAQAALRADDERGWLQDVLDATTSTSEMKKAIEKVVYDEEIVPESLIDDFDSLKSNLKVERFLEILVDEAKKATSPTPEAVAKIINNAQKVLLEELEDAIIDPVLNATSADDIAAAVQKAVWQDKGSKTAIPEDLLYNKLELATLLTKTEYKTALLYTKDMLKAQGSFKPSLKAIADITNAAIAVYTLETCNVQNSTQLQELTKLWKGEGEFEGYGDLFGSSFASDAKMDVMAEIYNVKEAGINSDATLQDVIKWSSALSVLSGASNKEAGKAFKDYASMYGIDTKAVEDANVSYDAIATYFNRSNLLDIYGKTAFNNEFKDALKDAKDAIGDVVGSKPEEGEFGNLTGGVETGRVPAGGGGGGGSDEPKPTPTPTPTPAPTSGFSDMKNFAWAEEAVANLVTEGVVSGNEKGEFEPSRSVTRGEFVKMLVVASKIKVDEGKAMHFADVPNGSWQHPYVQIAYSRGICRGTDDYTFNVNGTITRQDMAVMLTNLLNYLGVNSSGDAIEFTDAQRIADYAIGAVETATKAGLINGFDDGSFKPRESTRRVDAAMVISKLLELL